MQYRSHNLLIALLAATLLLLSSQAVFANIVRHFTIEALTESADIIVIGEVVETRTHLDRQTKRPITLTTITPEQTLKGKAKERITLRQIGGRIGKREIRIAGDPILNKGERILLFGVEKKKQPGIFFLKGMGQGAFKLVREHDKIQCVQLASGMKIFKQEAGSKERLQKAVPLRLPLESLLADIERALQKASQPPEAR